MKGEPTQVHIDGGIKPLEVRVKLDPVELKAPQGPTRLEIETKSLELRLPDKPLKVEGNLIPEKLRMDWGDKIPSLQLRLPENTPPFVVEVKGLSEGLTLNCTCKCCVDSKSRKDGGQDSPKVPQGDAPVDRQINETLQQLRVLRDTLSSNTNSVTNRLEEIETITTLTKVIEKLGKKLDDRTSPTSVLKVFGFILTGGWAGSLMRVLMERQKAENALPAERAARIANLVTALQQISIPPEALQAIPRRVKELLSLASHRRQNPRLIRRFLEGSEQPVAERR